MNPTLGNEEADEHEWNICTELKWSTLNTTAKQLEA